MHWFDVIVTEAGLDRDRAAAWVLFRSIDYWLWGLTYGLTEDPMRCARLVRIFR
jgi:streptomycin 6-kinase